MKNTIILLILTIISLNASSQCYYSQPTSFWAKSKTTGVTEIDNMLNNENLLLQAVFGVNIDLYIGGDKPNSKNAYFSPSCNLNNCTGEIWLGYNLMSSLFKKKHGAERLKAVFAHEYAHAMQSYYRWGGIGVEKELHADYLAGFYIGFKGGVNTDLLKSFVNEFYSMGDNNFYSPYHHGTNEERGCAFIEGFNVATKKHLNAYQAYLYGLDYVKLNSPCISFKTKNIYDVKPKNYNRPKRDNGSINISNPKKKYYRIYNQSGEFMVEIGPRQNYTIKNLSPGDYKLEVRRYSGFLESWERIGGMNFHVFKDILTIGTMGKSNVLTHTLTTKYDFKAIPGRKNFYYAQALVFFRENKWTDAEKQFSIVINTTNSPYNSYFYRAICRSNNENLEGAIKDYLDIINNARSINSPVFLYGTVYNNIGYCYLKLSNLEKAEEYINIAKRMAPYEYYIYGSSGELKYLQKDYQGSIDVMTKGIQLLVNNKSASQSLDRGAHLYYFRGLSYLKQGENEKACLDFQKAKSMKYPEAKTAIKEHCNTPNKE